MNFPSHATSSVNQVAGMYSGNPQALQQRTQPQNGVTPELIDLLALQKVQAEKKAAADQMAMQQGQAQPTVAQDMQQQAMQSARQEIQQKLGLPGIANQGQNVPQAGGAPQQAGAAPAAPPQGLPGIPSNLPEGYAQGGIVSFDEGGVAGDLPAGFVSPTGMSDGATGSGASPDDKNTSMWDRWISSLGQSATDAAPAIKQALRAIAHDGDTVTPAVVQSVADAVAPSSSKYAQRQGVGYEAPPSDADATATANNPPAVNPAANTSGSGSVAVRLPASGGLAGITRNNPEDPDSVDIRKAALKSIKSSLDPDLHDIMDKAVADPRYQQIVSDRAAGIEDQKQGLAKLQTLQEQGVANRPSTFTRGLQLMGCNLHSVGGIGAAFDCVSAGVDATNAGYNKEDIANQTTINGLIKAMNDAQASGDMETYNVAHSAMTSAVTQAEKAQTNATAMVDTNTKSRDAMLARGLQAEEMRMRAADAAASRGDTKSASILSAASTAAQTEGTRRANAEVAANPMDKYGNHTDANAMAQQYAAEILAKNDVYMREFKKYYGVEPTPSPAANTGTKTAGWSAKIVS